MYLFVDKYGNFRYSENKPIKTSRRKARIVRTEECEDYHGHFYNKHYYGPSDEIEEFWSLDNCSSYEPSSWKSNHLSNYIPILPDVGTVIPKELLKEEYRNLTFNDSPIKI